jgi:hypothetical protein
MKEYLYVHKIVALRSLKVHKIEIFFGFDFEICIISLLVIVRHVTGMVRIT